MEAQPGTWLFSREHAEPCRVLANDVVWGETSWLVWLPRQNQVLRVSGAQLAPMPDPAGGSPLELVYTTSAARILDALEQNALVAPLEAPVIPLPHQLLTLSRAVSGDQVRYLLADEVGLGKTIEAGLILRELKIRGLVERTLVVAPAGLGLQWVQEMKTHFGEDFRFVRPGAFGALRQLGGFDEHANLWRLSPQVVGAADAVKPVEGRRGWSHAQVARYNRERFDDLVTASWDLIIADEAHRLGGSGENVARYQLGEALAHAAPYLLLLTATPHQGKTDSFRRLMSFLDAQAFPDDDSVSRQQVAPYVIRNEKRSAIDADGQPLFRPRFTSLLPVAWTGEHRQQHALYQAVTDYAREGYNQALVAKRTAIGFLMILFQRLVTSSTRAIRSALERRLQALEQPVGQLSLFPEDVGDEWLSLAGQEQIERMLESRLRGLKNERSEVELLLSAARRCEARGPDAKAVALLDLVHKLQRDEQSPDLKILVFTEFVATQEMLAEFLAARGFSLVRLNGSMGLDERRAAQRQFASEVQVMVSTEAGGEGLNLQFCHVVVNYDLPWNPMRLEQRIGRVDRIGQDQVVRAFNLALADTVELRVREVLEEKLARILEEFGADKLGDVLDSEAAGIDFDQLYMRSILEPEAAEANVKAFTEELLARAGAARAGQFVLGEAPALDPAAARRIQDHQLPYWTERMTTAYLGSRENKGAFAQFEGDAHHLRFPDSSEARRAIFSRRDARIPGLELLTLEDPRVRALLDRLPAFAPGQPFPALEIPGVSDKVSGIWSLWRIALETPERRRQRILPVFLIEDGTALQPTARVVWDRLIELPVDAPPPAGDSADVCEIRSPAASVTGPDATAAYEASREAAEGQGEAIYRELASGHRERLARHRAKDRHAFAARRRGIERVGLPEVRQHRLHQLEEERLAWQQSMTARERAVPELGAILFVRVAKQGELG